jgi:hypothetical protein
MPCLPDTSPVPRHVDIPRIALRAMADFGTSRIISRAKYCGSRVAGRSDNYSVMSNAKGPLKNPLPSIDAELTEGPKP